MPVAGFKMALLQGRGGGGVLDLTHRQKNIKKLFLQNYMALVLEIRYVARPMVLYQVNSNEGPRVENGPTQGFLGLNQRKT